MILMALDQNNDFEQWIGKQSSWKHVVEPELSRRFHGTFDLPGAPPEIRQAVVPLLHFCLAQEAVPTSGLGHDGHPQRGGFLPPIALPRRMWAGGVVHFRADLCVGDTVRRVTTIRDIKYKEGRSGQLCLVVLDHRIFVGDMMVIEEQQDLVYRDVRNTKVSATPEAKKAVEPGVHVRPANISTVLLFRYSALTFNSHRIHYDLGYAQDIESYPGLVVHGPLQASLLMNMAVEIAGRRPTSFSFRSHAPLFHEGAASLNATEEDGALRLWSAGGDGAVATTALAVWA